jgi:putative DNA methylase
MNLPKRLIEVDLPIKRISAHARREKSIRHGHISTLHIWWARRPLAACRAVICAALWPDPVDVTAEDIAEAKKQGRDLQLNTCPPAFRDKAKELMREWATRNLGLVSAESFPRFNAISQDPSRLNDNVELRKSLFDFIADFANWDNSTVREYLVTSRALTQAAHEALGGAPGTRPLVVDPFAGGGSIPLEALRVGADAFASDLNPVPVLLNKVVLEYIPQYGERLADEVRKWGDWIKREAEKELAEFYPKDADGAKPIAYLWARTIQCEGPGCGAEVPLFNSPCLAQNGKSSVFLKLNCDKPKKLISFEIISGAPPKEELEGVLRRSSVTCPICKYTTQAANVRAQFKGRKGGAPDARLLAVVTTREDRGGRTYRLPQPNDLEIAREVARKLDLVRTNQPEDVPDEALPYLRSIFNIHLLDATKWSYLFSPRQLLSLIALVRIIRKLGRHLESSKMEAGLQAAICTCLAMAVDRVASQFSALTRWQPKGEFSVGTFGRQALGIVWDFVEIRPIAGASGDLDGAIEWISRVIASGIPTGNVQGVVQMASATTHPLPDDSAAAFVTDPPYYDAVPYADLSDFFYVFLKRMLKKQYPLLFETDLSPKQGEIVQLAERNPIYAYKTKDYFEKGMQEALAEGRRITVPSGVAVVVFAHKTTQGWEVMLSSVINAGWIVTASWPIDTERSVRPRASNSAALASSVHLVCRPREDPDGSVRTDEIGDWRDVLQELPRRIHEWMPHLAEEGVVGADAIFACIGPALEIFSRYSRVEKASGEAVTLKEYLEQVWAAVAKEALSMVFVGADATGFEEDARLTAMWLWTLSPGPQSTTGSVKDGRNEAAEKEETDDEEEGSEKAAKPSGFVLEYDAARKIAQGLGAHLEELPSLVEVKCDKARLLPVAERTSYLFGKANADGTAKSRKKKAQAQLFEELEEPEDHKALGVKGAPVLGDTALDRIHQSMILFAAGRSEALRRFLVEDGAGNDERFWRLANALSALYPASGDEKRWVDGVLAKKKSFGF